MHSQSHPHAHARIDARKQAHTHIDAHKHTDAHKETQTKLSCTYIHSFLHVYTNTDKEPANPQQRKNTQPTHAVGRQEHVHTLARTCTNYLTEL